MAIPPPATCLCCSVTVTTTMPRNGGRSCLLATLNDSSGFGGGSKNGAPLRSIYGMCRSS